jgi:hypothetical protein
MQGRLRAKLIERAGAAAGAHRGRDEIHRIAGVIKATHPDFQYRPIAPPEELGDGGRVRWVSGSPGKAPAYAGTDFITGTVQRTGCVNRRAVTEARQRRDRGRRSCRPGRCRP